MVYTSDYTLDYPADAAISDLFFDYNIGGAAPDSAAIIDGLTGQTTYTYGSLRLVVGRFARFLQDELHVGRGDVICILAFNTVHYPVYVHAVLAVGGIVSGLNPVHVPRELSHALSIAQPKHVLASPSLLPNLHAAFDLLSSTPQVTILSTRYSQGERSIKVDTNHILEHGAHDFKRVKYAEGEVAKELAFICFSSGTSGLPKGVKLSHGNIVSNVYMHSIYLSDMFTPDSVFALVVPFFHILGLQGFTCLYVLNGAPIVVFPKFDLTKLFRSIERDRITHLNVVPPIALQLLNSADARNYDCSSLRCLMNAAAPLDQASMDRLCHTLDCVLTQWYGLTEASPSVISQRQDQVQVKGSVGKLLPGIWLKILDSEGRDCAHGVPGELCIQGPNVMQGYVGDETLTDDVITKDNFLRTGDIGYVDDRGYVFLVDRLKEMIKVKGNQVAPAELEGILRQHPEVGDAAVRGRYIPERGTELPIAYITVRSAIPKTKGARSRVLQFVNEQVSAYKRLHEVLVVNDIPRNAGGKILRRLLPKADTLPESKL